MDEKRNRALREALIIFMWMLTCVAFGIFIGVVLR